VVATATPSTPPAFGEAEVSDNDRPPLASVAPRQSHPARDHADALERGGLGAGRVEFRRELALRRSSWRRGSL